MQRRELLNLSKLISEFQVTIHSTEKAIAATYLLILPFDNKEQKKNQEERDRLDAKLLQSIENKFNFNSCLWINVSNHRVNVLGIYEAFPRSECFPT